MENGEIVGVFAKQGHVEVRRRTTRQTDERTPAQHRLSSVDVAEEHREITPGVCPKAGRGGCHDRYSLPAGSQTTQGLPESKAFAALPAPLRRTYGASSRQHRVHAGALKGSRVAPRRSR